jgi:hypothetical protein
MNLRAKKFADRCTHACAARGRATRIFRPWTRQLARNSNKSGHALSRAAHPIWKQSTPGFLRLISMVSRPLFHPPSLQWRTASWRKTPRCSAKPPLPPLPAIKPVSAMLPLQTERMKGWAMLPEVPQVVPNKDAACLLARNAGKRATWPRRVRPPDSPILPVPPPRGEEVAVAA